MAYGLDICESEKIIISGATELNEIFENVVPWALEISSVEDLLDANTEKNPVNVEQFLDSIYLFKVDELSVSITEDNISDVIYKRHQTLITAAYQSNFTLTTVIVGNGGGSVEIYFGVSGDDSCKHVFQKQVQGIYPGKGISFVEESGTNRILKKKLNNARYGGIITGVPTLKIDNEKQKINLTSVIRSMNGQEYVLVIASRPVSKSECAKQIIQLMSLKDRCHALVNRSVGMQISNSENYSMMEQESSGNTETSSNNVGGSPSVMGSLATSLGVNLSGAVTVTAGVSFPATATISYTGTIGGTLGGAITAGGQFGVNGGLSNSTSTSKSTGTSETIGWSKSIGESLSYEQQNSMAMELELIADKLIQRLRAGLNSGIWENFITFSTTDAIGIKVLSGALSGELIKSDANSLPVRCVDSELKNDIKLYLPTKNGFSALNSNKLVSYMSSEEVALLMSPPSDSVPGFDIRKKPNLSLTDSSKEGSEHPIGNISEHGRAVDKLLFSISKSDIQKHIFVTGLTGSGKTTTVKQILASSDTPFLIIESAKREYRRLHGDQRFKGLKVFTIGDTLAPLRHNPFVVLPNISLMTHIDNLKSIFNASFALYGPMPYILEKCFFNIYRHKGWNITTGKHNTVQLKSISDCKTNRYIFPTIVDLKDEINRYVKDELDYKGELQDNIRSAIVTRLESLMVGSKGFIFSTYEFIDFEELLQSKVVFELESLADDDDKAFFVGLILAFVSEYRQSLARQSILDQTSGLKHIMVIEEAHRLLKNISTERTSEMMGNPKGKAVEAFCNIIAEMRSLGQGVIVAEQIPTKIAPDVIKNTNTKVVHRLVAYDDQSAMGAGMGLDENECRYYNQLSVGFALAHKEGMSKPVELQIFDTLPNSPVGDIKFIDDGKKQFFDWYHQNLDIALDLHESGLIWNDDIQKIAFQVMNSIFLAGNEIYEILPVVINEIRKNSFTTYILHDKTVAEALKQWLFRILFSQTVGLTNNKIITKEIIDAYERFWSDGIKFDRLRFVSAIDKWSSNDSRSKIKEFSLNTVLLEPECNRSKGLSMLTFKYEENVHKEMIIALRERLGN